MKYRMYGNMLQLIKFKISYLFDKEIYIENCINEDHKNEVELNLTKQGVKFTTTAINQPQYEWLNEMTFNQEQINEGYIEKAIELGEVGFKEFLFVQDENLQLITMVLDLDYRLGLQEMGVIL